jgi:ectoine hydroxylase-related dioxygenase (phytanoyl-CoA dioxygenase family)
MYFNYSEFPANKKFLEGFNENGFFIINNALTDHEIQKALEELAGALKCELEYHKGAIDYPFYGYVLNNACYGGIFIELISERRLFQLVELLLGENMILYSYTSSSMPPKLGNPSSTIHVDSPIWIKNYPLRVGVMIPLVDFTMENGATTYLPGSHLFEQRPSDEAYSSHSKKLLVNAGSMFIFDARLWHSGGINSTDKWRHALTFNWCRPWMKQYVNMPKLLGSALPMRLNLVAQKRLGYFSSPPESYEEYFNINKRRFFL